MTIALPLDYKPASLSHDVERAISRARSFQQPVLLTRIERIAGLVDPLAFLAASAAELGGGNLWWQPRTATAFAGAGAAMTIRANGPARFETIAAELRRLPQFLVLDPERATFPIVGGLAFRESDDEHSPWSDFPDAMLVVPAVGLQTCGDSTLVRATLRVEPTAATTHIERQFDDLFAQAFSWSQETAATPKDPPFVIAESLPDRASWESAVATSIALIRQGLLDKVVLAREERLRASHPFSPFDTLARLRLDNEDATLFALRSGTRWFLGATPERLVRLERGRVDVTCLAGSIGAGRSPRERQQLAARLLASPKDREEHEIVVRSTLHALEEVCEDVERFPGTPRVFSARSVQHLETPIRARVASAGHVLDLVERLHPTPAVGGYPRNAAALVIREFEGIERGWYAGPFGWTNIDGSGEFAVAIRSALLSGRTATVYAGAGIVAESDPGAEFAETTLKMRPMLAALGAL